MKDVVNHPIGDFIRTQIPDPTIAFIINGLISVMAILAVVFGSAPMLIWMERKVSAHMQARLGPMRVGPHGLLQTAADILKLLMKEILKPKGADTLIFWLAPLLPLTASFLVLVVIPFDHHMQVTDLDMGVLYVAAISGLGIVGILIGGWASNNKYSLLGSMRSGAQMVSYEISLALGLLFVVLISGETSLREIVFTQQGSILDWWIFKIPVLGFLGFTLFTISSIAELNRGPFDIAEAEQEITAGFHTEYTGMAFAIFFLAEYINMVVAGSLAATFFLGGFLAPLIGVPFIDNLLIMIPGYIWFGCKVLFMIFLFMWARWTFPRPRVDQLMGLEWKFLLPANLLLLVLGAFFLIMGWVL
jgi:NADH-quinone oxidoreductase subunit H